MQLFDLLWSPPLVAEDWRFLGDAEDETTKNSILRTSTSSEFYKCVSLPFVVFIFHSGFLQYSYKYLT